MSVKESPKICCTDRAAKAISAIEKIRATKTSLGIDIFVLSTLHRNQGMKDFSKPAGLDFNNPQE
ncbi:hypothetical protein Fmac_017556 [Flemingia macrophylla]|uniref:Uncharacterized protein n=1 Tax=Flemingia macrophylla TaxID=520843 RepID=A0ABD1M4A3_9FABA